MEQWSLYAPISGFLALVMAAVLYVRVKSQPAGNERMNEISGYIREGSMAFLSREYKILGVYSLVLFGVLMIGISGESAWSFLLGAILSLVAGFAGMNAATLANVRTAEAARDKTRGHALMVAFDGGAVMGLCVAGLGIIGLGLLFHKFHASEHFTHIIHGFGVGASSIALFARIGGGIYTKAADVGADLAGKVIAGIPEDDPRNPGVIADNVGDNVGDVAGMGADIFESYVAASVAAMALAITLPLDSLAALIPEGLGVDESFIRGAAKILPLVLACVGLLVSMGAIALLRVFKNATPALALRYALLLPPIVFIGIVYVIIGNFGLSQSITLTVAAGAIGGGITLVPAPVLDASAIFLTGVDEV